ncbi:MAG: DUF2007 domain-containing protein [Polyangiaceae bacterium]
MRVYVAQDIIEAQLVLDILLEGGVAATLRNVNLVGAYPELPVRPEIWLERPEQFATARGLIDQFEGNRMTILDDVKCPACMEVNPGNFELCWKCRAEIPASSRRE